MRPFLPFATLLGAAFLLSCQEQGSIPVGPEGQGPQFHPGHAGDCKGHDKKDNPDLCGGNGDGGKTFFSVDLVPHTASFNPSDPTLVSTCSGTAEDSNYSVSWPRFSECVTITPTGGYQLNNDPVLTFAKKRGSITGITFFIDDVVGGDGIQHETDQIPVDPAAEPSPSGFTVHVHADGVEVWRLKGHLGGPRVQMIGTISIADVVFVPAGP